MGPILYVARDKRHPDRYDLGSTLCMRAIELAPREVAFDVREVHGDTPNKPVWLVGTPTLLADGEVHRGRHALEHVQRLAVDLATHHAAEHATRAAHEKRATRGSSIGSRGSSHTLAIPKAAAPALHMRAEKEEEQATATQRPERADADEGDVDEDMQTLWDSHIDDNAETDDGGKITGDDLARAMREREAATKLPPASQAPPAPPSPMREE
jgi:hypothetical protein